MGKIHLLDNCLIDKIAAGEVVERCASVVKELVENAIDAGSRNIKIELEDGGRKLIAVVDDGRGIAPEDAILATQRHATSKLSGVDDLFNISTMGFRGEALASIAAVSKFTIFSRKKEGSGFKLDISGGGKPTVQEWSGDFGTSVLVSELFYNVPVRRNFLKQAKTELAYCHETVYSLALANPHIGFKLSHNGRVWLDIAGCGEKSQETWHESSRLRQRVADLFAKKYDVAGLIYTCQKSRFGSCEALLSPPGVERATSKDIYAFVNGRYVKDRAIRYGILKGYQTHLLRGRYPVAILYLNIEPGLVDVNVHPTKIEVRFQYANEVQSFLSSSIRAAFEREIQSPSVEGAQKDTATRGPSISGGMKDFDLAFSPQKMGISDTPVHREVTSSGHRGRGESLRGSGRQGAFDAQSEVIRTVERFDGGKKTKIPFNGVAQSPLEELPLTPSRALGEHEPLQPFDWERMGYLGVLFKCYLLFETPDSLIAVDQHAFHERLLFELLKKDRSQLLRSESLLIPEALSLSPSEISTIAERGSRLRQLGFDIETLDPSTCEIKAVPSLLKDKEFEDIISDLADSNHSLAEGGGYEDDILARIACKGACKKGELVEEEELRVLFNQAQRLNLRLTCPHGRKIYHVLTKSKIEGWFDR